MIQILFMWLVTLFIFHIISDVIFPVYKSNIAPLQQWYWMMDECNYILALIRKENVGIPDYQDGKKYLRE